MNGYELSRIWFDFCFENPEKVKPNHTALYFFAVEHCNRLGWKSKFGFPTEMVKDAIGIKNYRTYINTLNDLIEFGFIEMIEKSKNQYSANIIALVNYTKATTKALDKASIKHLQKQSQSNYKSIDSIDKQLNNKPETKKPIYIERILKILEVEEIEKLKFIIEKDSVEEEPSINTIPISNRQEEMKQHLLSQQIWLEQISMNPNFSGKDVPNLLLKFLDEQILKGSLLRSEMDIKSHFINWLKTSAAKTTTVSTKAEEILKRYT